jgi:hypothetical protein
MMRPAVESLARGSLHKRCGRLCRTRNSLTSWLWFLFCWCLLSPSCLAAPAQVTSDPRHFIAPLEAARHEKRFSLGVRAGFSLPQNDLKLTTGSFPDFTLGAYGQFRLGSFQHIRASEDWWSFNRGVQTSHQPQRDQTIRTRIHAAVAGVEYLQGLPAPLRRFDAGGGVYLTRWSVDSVDSVTLGQLGTAQAAGTSHWTRWGGGASGAYRVNRHLAIESRWIRTSYGYEHLPVSVVLLGAGWRF